MALIVEDGTIVTDANGYITEAFLVGYWADRNVIISTATEENEAAIIIATQFVDQNNDFKGSIVDDDQSLSWPRFGVTDCEGRAVAADIIPLNLKNAVAEYAYRQTTTTLQPDVPQDGDVKRLKTKVDVIEKETEYTEGTSYNGNVSYPMADNYIKCYLVGGSGGNFGRIGVC